MKLKDFEPGQKFYTGMYSKKAYKLLSRYVSSMYDILRAPDNEIVICDGDYNSDLSDIKFLTCRRLKWDADTLADYPEEATNVLDIKSMVSILKNKKPRSKPDAERMKNLIGEPLNAVEVEIKECLEEETEKIERDYTLIDNILCINQTFDNPVLLASGLDQAKLAAALNAKKELADAHKRFSDAKKTMTDIIEELVRDNTAIRKNRLAKLKAELRPPKRTGKKQAA